MELLAGIGIIVFGIVYMLYRLGKDEFDGNTWGGILFVLIPIALISVFALFGGVMQLSFRFLGLWGGAIVGFTCVGLFIARWIKANKKDRKEEADRQQSYKELSECVAIAKTLPLPTCSQMNQFIHEIRHIENPSQQQQSFRRRLQSADANIHTNPVDASCFKETQSGWIYFSKHNSNSSFRKETFGDQDLSKMTYLDPSINRTGEPVTGQDCETFQKLVQQIPLKLKGSWCCHPSFARRVFSHIEKTSSLSAEDLYLFMFDAYTHPESGLSESAAADIKAERAYDLAVVQDFLRPKVRYALSEIPFSREEKQEWLKNDDFYHACIPAVKEQRFLSAKELFPQMLQIYNNLPNADSSSKTPEYLFVTLWYGLDNVGRCVGKPGDFFDFPKYIVHEEEKDDHP